MQEEQNYINLLFHVVYSPLLIIIFNKQCYLKMEPPSKNSMFY